MSRILRDIKISEKELNYILSNCDGNDHGSEGIIIKQDDKRNVRKIFFDHFGLLYPTEEKTGRIRENKLSKLDKLYQINNFDNDVKVSNSVSCNGKLVGYDMVSDKINYPYVTAPLLRDEKIKFLKQIKKKLEYFHGLGIVFGDVRNGNILIDKRKKNISFCDLDNIQIDRNPIDLINRYIIDFPNKDLLVDKKADYYMYNLLLLNELLYEHYDYEHILKKISSNLDFDKDIDLFNETGITNIKKMVNVKNKYTGGYLIDNLKK